MTCSHCGNAAHLDLADKREHCNPCHRVPAFCRCAPVKTERRPVWLDRIKAKELVAA